MQLLDEIIGWAEGLRPWQQEAMRRIFAQAELTQDDMDTILRMVLEQEDENVSKVAVQSFTLDDVPGTGSGANVRIVGISGLDQVNGFPSGRAIDLQSEGMTIFFGHNGAGKSGYARVFKNACKARHRVDVLPDAFVTTTPVKQPSADFAILVDGTPVTVRWEQNGPPNLHLSSVSVYDSACANDYIDAEGTPAFQPYGLTHLTRLVLLQRDLQARIAADRTALALDIRQFEALKGETEVGRYISNLGKDSILAELTRLGTVGNAELQRLDFLKRTSLESDPVPQALNLERLATRLEQAKGRAEMVQRWVNDRAIARAKELIKTEKTAHLAMQLAQARLQGHNTLNTLESKVTSSATPTLLEGTGHELWQVMYRAAEAFSLQAAYTEHPFPHLAPEAYCLLCQQPYSNVAVERMQRFAAFVADRATSEAQTATLARMSALEKVRAVDLNILDVPTTADVEERLPDLHTAITTAVSVWISRHIWVSDALQTGDCPSESELLPPEANLDSLFAAKAALLRLDADTLRKSADPTVRLALSQELAELEARQRLSNQLVAVERFIKDSQAHANLSRCHAALNPATVSRKLTSLAATYVTEALAAAMNAELKALGYKQRVQPDLSGRTDLGITKVMLRLQKITAKASKVLSEGEQRALGMAMFLAELESLPHTSTVIFDDPSTSLDHIYRRAIARRLVRLAETRQVLVFTHDAVFLTELAMALQYFDCTVSYKTIGWDESPGLVNEGLTWTTMDTRARLADLESRAKALKVPADSYPDDELERQIASGYSSLRGTVERAIREVFLNNTVQPFSDVVSVEAFGAVIGHPVEEWELLQAVYSRACEATEAHDTPSERQLALPTREDLMADIALLSELIKNAAKRRTSYENQRRERTAKRKSLLGN